MSETAVLTILLNPPKGFRGDVDFMIGINDEKLAEGHAHETVNITLEKGYHEILVLVRDKGVNSMSSTTPIQVEGDMSLKIKYGLFSKKAELVMND